MTTCSRCLNDTRNPTIRIENNLCNICRSYDIGYNQDKLKSELDSIIGRDAMVGISGGKDSTATLHAAKSIFNHVTAFTFDTGYYPAHIEDAAVECAMDAQVYHEIIDIRPYISNHLRKSFQMTADLYDRLGLVESYVPSATTSSMPYLYQLNRQHYSASDTTEIPFLRACQLCRKMVIPAYYGEAIKRGAEVVVLGMNEWTHLSGTQISGVRVLKPFLGQPAVKVVHLPFLLGWTLHDTKNILDKLGWRAPSKEDLVETNGNSCCLARATQLPFQQALGFHPDTTRLSREITCGFLSREVAAPKLELARPYTRTIRQVLVDAGIL